MNIMSCYQSYQERILLSRLSLLDTPLQDTGSGTRSDSSCKINTCSFKRKMVQYGEVSVRVIFACLLQKLYRERLKSERSIAIKFCDLVSLLDTPLQDTGSGTRSDNLFKANVSSFRMLSKVSRICY